jgi:ketosteroid isomerase-like protein
MSELSIADRQAIEDTLRRYCHCIDRGRWDEFATLFTDDCRLDLSQVLGLYEGADGIRQFGDTMRSVDLFMRHLLTNVVVHGDGARAHAESYVLAITGPKGSAPQQSTGIYEDELIKRDGRWLLHRRHLTLDVGPAR